MLDIELYAASGKAFDGHYRMIRPLSTSGGTADVWLALDMNTVADAASVGDLSKMTDEQIDQLGLIVAIKVYRPLNALDIEGEQHFRDEYMIVFNCHHTNLIHPTHFSIFKEIPYLVLPYCKNGSAERLIGKIGDPDDTWKFIGDVSSGLAYLHALTPPIIHQDIKPGNVLIDDNQYYSITDFGISAKSGGTHGDTFEEEERSGTMAYMAPERYHEGAESSPASDVWAFGAMLYEMLTGNVPFGEEGGWVQVEKPDTVPAMPESIPADVQRLILACLDADPAKRPTAEYISRAAAARQYPLKPKKTGLIIGIIALCALLLGVGAAFLFKGDPEVKILEAPRIAPEVAYEQAITRMNMNDVDSLQAGMALMDSLSGANYVPAIYEMAHTYGWYSDSISVKRKALLGIDIYQDGDSKFLPKNEKWTGIAVGLFSKMLDLKDSTQASLNAEAAYRLACYYEVPNKIYQRNEEKSRKFLIMARDWAQLAGDSVILERANNGLQRLGAK